VDRVVLTPRGAGARDRIVMRPRQRPFVPATDLVGAAWRRLTGDEAPEPRTTTLVTDEGEYAVLATARGAFAGEELELSAAVVVGDESFLRFDGVAFGAERARMVGDTLRHLVASSRLGLDRERRRRYLYPPPTGWEGVAQDLVTVWLGPRFPAEPTSITVYPAWRRPRLDRSVRGGTTTRTRHGLSATTVHEIEPGGLYRDRVILDDGAVEYLVRLEATAATIAAARRDLAALVDGIQPLPGRPSRGASAAVEHWID
jgi:hypothetical protein